MANLNVTEKAKMVEVEGKKGLYRRKDDLIVPVEEVVSVGERIGVNDLRLKKYKSRNFVIGNSKCTESPQAP